MNTLRNKLIRLIIEQTTDELPNYPVEVAKEIMKIYESTDNDLIRNIQSLMDYYKSH